MGKKIRKGNIVTIDFDYWVTQADKARLDGVSYHNVRQWVQRSIQGTTPFPIETWTIPELGVTLVARDQKIVRYEK